MSYNPNVVNFIIINEDQNIEEQFNVPKFLYLDVIMDNKSEFILNADKLLKLITGIYSINADFNINAIELQIDNDKDKTYNIDIHRDGVE